MTKLTASQVQEICEGRESGRSLGELALAFNVSPSAISYHCYQNAAFRPGLDQRGRARGRRNYTRNGHKVRVFTPEEDAIIRERRAKGDPFTVIAEQLNRRPHAVRQRAIMLEYWQAAEEDA
jgi:hypothetical protein